MSKNDRPNWDKVRWTPFREGEFKDLLPMVETNKEHVRVFLNSIYQVQVEWIECPPPFGHCAYLSIKTLDKSPRHDWRELQRIKTELIGEEVEAIELYPAESRVVDTANQYHLFCFPRLETDGHKFPFGFDARIISEGSSVGISETGKGSRQRDFRPELKPDDVIRGERLDEITKAVLTDKNFTMTKGRCPVDSSQLVHIGDVQASFGEKTVTTARLECMTGKHVFYCGTKSEMAEIEKANDGE